MLIAAAAGSTATASNPGSGAAKLRVQAQTLDTKAHRALLSLYALDARYGTARRMLAGLEAESQRLRGAQRVLTQQVSAAHNSLVVSQQLLADHLRALYEEGDADPLAIVLGADGSSGSARPSWRTERASTPRSRARAGRQVRWHRRAPTAARTSAACTGSSGSQPLRSTHSR